jgi:hypothetical protein
MEILLAGFIIVAAVIGSALAASVLALIISEMCKARRVTHTEEERDATGTRPKF